MIGVGSYCCACDDRPLPSSKTSWSCWPVELFCFLGFGNRRDELDATPFVYDALGRLTLCIELPVLARIFIRGVEDRTLKKAIFHVQVLSWCCSQTSEAERTVLSSLAVSASCLAAGIPSRAIAAKTHRSAVYLISARRPVTDPYITFSHADCKCN